jgi:hypothetical protein
MKLSMNRAAASLITLALLWLIHELRKFADRSAPIGYEDEEGFHFGVAPDSATN